MTTATLTRKTLTRDMRLPHPAEDVFPLLCPVREYEWIEMWRCELLHSRSGLAEENCVFRTDFPGEEGRVWQVSRYEPPRRIEFVTFVASSCTTRLNLTLEDDAQGVLLRWEQVFSALEPRGAALIDAWTGAHYQIQMQMLEDSLGHYLATGTMLRTGG
jgi:hypothetical protein